MKSREFSIKTERLEIQYDTVVSIDFIEEFLQEDLEVPAQYLESFDIKDKLVNIKLSLTREYFNDDWYINLQRVS